MHRRLTLAISLALVAMSAHAAGQSPDTAAQDAASSNAETAAESPQSPSSQSTGALRFGPLRVQGQQTFRYQEGMTLDDAYIHTTSKGNGDIATLLRINPAVQFSDIARTSRNMGEIRPEDFSINGGLYYQNAFLVDGVSFNNDIDGGSTTDASNIIDIPSQPQGVALDTALLESLTVYDSNVPAEFGGFNGGVVDAKTRKAGNTLNGRISYRMSRSAWNNYHLNESQRERFELSAQPVSQPRYDKYQVASMLEGRTQNGLGIIGSISYTRSDIPLRGFANGNVSENDELFKGNTRENLNASLRLDWSNDTVSLGASIVHAPTDERYFILNSKNAYFDIKQGGPVVGFRADVNLGAWTYASSLNYSNIESSRRGQQGIDYYKTWAQSAEHNWGINGQAAEGNWGNIDQESRSLGYKLRASRDPFVWGRTQHRINYGATLSDRRTNYRRLSELSNYQTPVSTTNCDTPTGLDTVACSLSPVTAAGASRRGMIEGQGQYMSELVLYRAGEFSASALEWGLHLEDDIQVGDFGIRIGARVDGDDIVDQVTISPRLSTRWDVFGDATTIATAGVNRYYGRSFFSYLLREGRERLKTEYVRGSDMVWRQDSETPAYYQTTELDVPYSDEFAAGLQQSVGGVDIGLKYVRRLTNDEVVRTRRRNDGDGDDFFSQIYEYANLGRSQASIYSMTLSPQSPWATGPLTTTALMAFDYSDTRRNFQTYDENFTEIAFNEAVWYRGHVILANQLPASSYNRPWTARLSTSTRIESLDLLWSNFLRYRAGYETTRANGRADHEGESLRVIEDVKNPRSWSWDSTLEWTLPLSGDQQWHARIEVQNVLDRRTLIQTASSGDDYEPGRSYWLEVGYRF